ncbi:MAG: hypothetical protein AB1762_07240, partial [Gemmatimonadota bacterium]
MRVLVLVTDMTWTGRARALVGMARGLASRGHAVALLVDPASGAHSQAASSASATLQIVAFPARGRRRGSARVRALRAAIRQHDSGVVFVHSEG